MGPPVSRRIESDYYAAIMIFEQYVMKLFYDDYLNNPQRFKKYIDKDSPNWREWAAERFDFPMAIATPNGGIF